MNLHSKSCRIIIMSTIALFVFVFNESIYCNTERPVEIVKESDLIQGKYNKYELANSAFKLVRIDGNIYLFYVTVNQMQTMARYEYLYKKVVDSNILVNSDPKLYLNIIDGTSQGKETKIDICYFEKRNQLVQVREDVDSSGFSIKKDVFNFNNGMLEIVPEESETVKMDNDSKLLRSTHYTHRNPKLYLQDEELILTYNAYANAGYIKRKNFLFIERNLLDKNEVEDGFLEIDNENIRFIETNKFLCLNNNRSSIEQVVENEYDIDENEKISGKEDLSGSNDISNFEFVQINDDRDKNILVFQRIGKPGLFIGKLDDNGLKRDTVLALPEINTKSYSIEMDNANIYVAYMDNTKAGRSIKMISIGRSSIME
jgi:hypothetical protein